MNRYLLFLAFALPSCHPLPAPPVVAPVGPATAAVDPAIAATIKAQEGQLAANQAVLSKVSASAGAITSINSGQPIGPRTDGIAGEATLIRSVAGEPTAADALAASERARIVAEGKAADIAKAYASAAQQAQEAAKALVSTQAALDSANAALSAQQASAKAEQATQAASLQRTIDKIQADANARVAAAESKTRTIQQAILFGLGAILFAGGMVVLLGMASIPSFGPRAGFALLAAGAGLIAVGVVVSTVQTFLDRHPWVVGTAIGVCAILTTVAACLVYGNHKAHQEAVKVAALPPTVTPIP